MNNVEMLKNFLDASPVNYYAIKNSEDLLKQNGFLELFETEKYSLKKGGKYYVKRNNTSIIAFIIGKNVKDNYSFHIVASHTDSPCLKIKPIGEKNTEGYKQINVEVYGGMIMSSWLDRPLSIAGRVIYKDEDNIVSKNVNLANETLMIPNLCIHFNRDINNGYNYNPSIDLQAFIGENLPEDYLKNKLAESLNIEKNQILNYDLYLYNKEKALIWGPNNDYISSPRLDDLECVYTSLLGFIDGVNDSDINMFIAFDNEEVGSSSRQGANSDFLVRTLSRINKSLGYDEEILSSSIAKSFIISADNAHALHPNYLNKYDSNNRVFMNKGIGIKFNAAQSYTSDGLSSSIFQQICLKASVPYQLFTNRSDIRGGSTLGNIALNKVSPMAVDIGLGQLAMHSSYETAGTKDVDYAIKAFKEFYSSKILISKNKIKVE